MPLPTASGLQRAMLCPGSMVLPTVKELDVHNADRGTEAHAFVEQCLNGGNRDDVLLTVPEEHREFCANIDLSSFPVLLQLRTEVAYGMDCATGAVACVGEQLGRAYPKEANCVYGSADYVGVDVAGMLVVADLKTGDSFVPSPDANWQLKFLGMCAAKVAGVSSVSLEIWKLKDGSIMRLRQELDAFELDVINLDVQSLYARLKQQAAGPTFVTGDHCRYCPSRLYCPTQTALIKELAGESAMDMSDQVRTLLSPATAAAAYLRLKSIEAILANVKKALYAYAQETPIELPDGRIFGPRPTVKEELDGETVFTVVKEMHGVEVAAQAVEFKGTKTSIEKAARILKPMLKKPIYKIKDDILEAVRGAGGIKVTAGSITEVYDKEE